LTGIRIFFEGFISTAGMRELSAHFRLDVDYSAHVIPFRAKSTRHKTAYKADNIAPLAAATQWSQTLRPKGCDDD
jgi:hypothetical protein